MPTYPLKNLKTGEEQELTMSMKEYDQWRKDNPDWDKDWSKGAGGVVSATGDVYSSRDARFKGKTTKDYTHITCHVKKRCPSVLGLV